MTQSLQHILAFVIKDEVGALRVPTLVRAKHDVVGRGISEARGITQLGTDLHIATTTLNVLAGHTSSDGGFQAIDQWHASLQLESQSGSGDEAFRGQHI